MLNNEQHRTCTLGFRLELSWTLELALKGSSRLCLQLVERRKSLQGLARAREVRTCVRRRAGLGSSSEIFVAFGPLLGEGKHLWRRRGVGNVLDNLSLAVDGRLHCKKFGTISSYRSIRDGDM